MVGSDGYLSIAVKESQSMVSYSMLMLIADLSQSFADNSSAQVMYETLVGHDQRLMANMRYFD